MLKQSLLLINTIAGWLGLICVAATAQPVVVNETVITGVKTVGTIRVN